MEENQKQPRLCSEIQLFDLCEVGAADVCGHRDGRYCTKGDLLARFEAIADDDRSPEQYFAEELDDAEGADDLGYDEAFGVDEYGEEDEE
ncbi:MULTISPECIES: hypothetical protein [Geobacter]|uniref:hypothetical protein n=1 Tax=Geobacter TaxID=28231 RepID=UPI00257233D2|nr:hypothetical protein [Geobacter sulfurreducens]BEH10368.1 hypothetical protein GSUET_19800 [Geobacter sulfurreducens subsp. ethanolicus]